MKNRLDIEVRNAVCAALKAHTVAISKEGTKVKNADEARDLVRARMVADKSAEAKVFRSISKTRQDILLGETVKVSRSKGNAAEEQAASEEVKKSKAKK